jgi:predicted Rossmann fold flavoprotein
MGRVRTGVECILHASPSGPYGHDVPRTHLSNRADADTADVVVVGAGAAGLMTAIVTSRNRPSLRVVIVDGARRIGAKILVSGGSRCNVTNRIVEERDFWGGSSRHVRAVLRAFPAAQAVEFFRELDVTLHEEEDGKLFPDSNRSRTVLDALLREVDRHHIELRTGNRVAAIDRRGGAFVVATSQGELRAAAVVLATGGRSLPKTGSDGSGYSFAARLAHGYVETTPALVPLVLDDDRHAALSGVAHRGEITVRVAGRTRIRLEGSLLWTHFGASGPLVLNASRHWHRAKVDGAVVELLLNSCPGETFESLERWLLAEMRARPRALVTGVVAARLPASVAGASVAAAAIGEARTMAHLDRDARRALLRTLLEQPLQVRDSRGYSYAEVTAGGVPLEEIDSATMESRCCPGLYLVGEILDVDGRLGGFNFQWAWSSGFVAGRALAARLSSQAEAAT